MKIILNGIETNNKGAELMLYAILQEIERKFPDAEVFVPYFAVRQGLKYVRTNLKLRYKPFSFMFKFRIPGILRRLHLPQRYYNVDAYPIKDVDFFIDASGFAVSDQWHPKSTDVEHWRLLLSNMKTNGAKIVFLPQAFGPIEGECTKQLVKVIDRYADLIMPRERVSLRYLKNSFVNSQKIKCYPDFTNLVEGTPPPLEYAHLANGVCIIPNMRMIDQGVITFDHYLNIIKQIANLAINSGRKVYLLNHEGLEDAELGRACVEQIGENISFVTGLNALEVKGLISTSYLCISSRYHGVVSALNSCVPCLATSWSHKYEELFIDYGMTDCVLNLNDINSVIKKASEYLDPQTNASIRAHLVEQLPIIKKATCEMWRYVWELNEIR